MLNPILKIELEGLKASVCQHLGQHNEAINGLVKESLDKTMTEEWVKTEIQKAVDETVRKAIINLSDNWRLKSAIEDALAKAVSKMVDNA